MSNIATDQEPRCVNCGEAGHWAMACYNDRVERPLKSSSRAQHNHSARGSNNGGGTTNNHGSGGRKKNTMIITKYAPPPKPQPLATPYSAGVPSFYPSHPSQFAPSSSSGYAPPAPPSWPGSYGAPPGPPPPLPSRQAGPDHRSLPFPPPYSHGADGGANSFGPPGQGTGYTPAFPPPMYPPYRQPPPYRQALGPSAPPPHPGSYLPSSLPPIPPSSRPPFPAPSAPPVLPPPVAQGFYTPVSNKDSNHARPAQHPGTGPLGSENGQSRRTHSTKVGGSYQRNNGRNQPRSQNNEYAGKGFDGKVSSPEKQQALRLHIPEPPSTPPPKAASVAPEPSSPLEEAKSTSTGPSSKDSKTPNEKKKDKTINKEDHKWDEEHIFANPVEIGVDETAKPLGSVYTDEILLPPKYGVNHTMSQYVTPDNLEDYAKPIRATSFWPEFEFDPLFVKDGRYPNGLAASIENVPRHLLVPLPLGGGVLPGPTSRKHARSELVEEGEIESEGEVSQKMVIDSHVRGGHGSGCNGRQGGRDPKRLRLESVVRPDAHARRAFSRTPEPPRAIHIPPRAPSPSRSHTSGGLLTPHKAALPPAPSSLPSRPPVRPVSPIGSIHSAKVIPRSENRRDLREPRHDIHDSRHDPRYDRPERYGSSPTESRLGQRPVHGDWREPCRRDDEWREDCRDGRRDKRYNDRYHERRDGWLDDDRYDDRRDGWRDDRDGWRDGRDGWRDDRDGWRGGRDGWRDGRDDWRENNRRDGYRRDEDGRRDGPRRDDVRREDDGRRGDPKRDEPQRDSIRRDDIQRDESRRDLRPDGRRDEKRDDRHDDRRSHSRDADRRPERTDDWKGSRHGARQDARHDTRYGTPQDGADRHHEGRPDTDQESRRRRRSSSPRPSHRFPRTLSPSNHSDSDDELEPWEREILGICDESGSGKGGSDSTPQGDSGNEKKKPKLTKRDLSRMPPMKKRPPPVSSAYSRRW